MKGQVSPPDRFDKGISKTRMGPNTLELPKKMRVKEVTTATSEDNHNSPDSPFKPFLQNEVQV